MTIAKLALLQPNVLAIRHTGDADQVILDLHVPSELAHFPGHFPNLPILPGVVQIDWAIRYSSEYFPLTGQFVALEDIKFLSITLPDARIQLTLKWDAKNMRLTFIYATSEKKHSSGRIVFGFAQ